MKWFEPGLDENGLKKAYRALARQHHPDNYMQDGEDAILKAEQVMKEINEEYATYFTQQVKTRATYLAAQDRIYNELEIARQIQRDLYPKTLVNYVAFFEDALLEFLQNTPMRKMLEIIDIARKSVSCPLYAAFTRSVRKKEFRLRYPAGTGCVYIDTEESDVFGLDWKEVKTGRRYKVYKAPRFDMVHDVKTDTRYFMRHSNKVDLLEDLVK